MVRSLNQKKTAVFQLVVPFRSETLKSMLVLLYRKITRDGGTYVAYSTQANDLRICMPGNVNDLTILECISALRQAFLSVNFRRNNPHLSSAEFAGLLSTPIVWPLKPVFSPYSETHDSYTQIRYRGTKYLLHRLSLRAHLEKSLAAGLDCSHIMHLGDITGKNFNPLHIVEETNILNQSRKACAVFIDKWNWEWENGVLGLAAWGEKDNFNACIQSLSGFCGFIHQPRCQGWDPSWGDLQEVVDVFS